MTNRASDRAISLQSATIVVVFAGRGRLPFTTKLAEEIVGKEPKSVETPTDEGLVVAWDDGLSMLTRRQGPNQVRIECKLDFASVDAHDILSNYIRDIIGAINEPLKTREPMAVGVNTVALMIDTSGASDGILDTLVNNDSASNIFGRKSMGASEMTLTTRLLPRGLMRFQMTEVMLPNMRGANGLLLRPNHETQTNSMAQVERALDIDRLKRINTFVHRVFRRIEKVKSV